MAQKAKLSSPWHADIMDPKVGPSTMMRSMAALGTTEISWHVGEYRMPFATLIRFEV
jgi:hypothetical protein